MVNFRSYRHRARSSGGKKKSGRGLFSPIEPSYRSRGKKKSGSKISRRMLKHLKEQAMQKKNKPSLEMLKRFRENAIRRRSRGKKKSKGLLMGDYYPPSDTEAGYTIGQFVGGWIPGTKGKSPDGTYRS